MAKKRPRFRHRSFRDQRHAIIIFVVVNLLAGIALISAAVYGFKR